MQSVIFFGAHADDIELGAGGTCAKLAAAGFDVHIAVATDEADAKVAAIRREEAIAAAEVLGVPRSRVHFLGLTDGLVRCERDTVGRLRTMFRDMGLKPCAVFTHTECDSHQDHVELTRIVRGTFRNAAVFKYIVRNSAIVSHFRPDFYSAVDAFIPAKSRALCLHATQMAVGRVSPELLINFSRRYALNLQGRHFEPFELEVQEGASDYQSVLDYVNDAPFSRLWQPLCSASGITVHAPPPSLAPRRAAISHAPDPLQLVTRLQGDMMRVLQGQSAFRASAILTVETATDAHRAQLSDGVSVLLGGPGLNPLSAYVLDSVPSLPFRMDIAPNENGGFVIADMESDGLLAPTYWPGRGRAVEVGSDYGLLTVVRMGAASDSKRGIAIVAAGIHEPGLAAAMTMITRMDYIARIVDDLRQVTCGSAPAVQVLIPCDRMGTPNLSNLRAEVLDSRVDLSMAQLRTIADTRVALTG